MGEKKTLTVLVSGGEATAGPPLGPQLGPLGVNIVAIVEEINKKTQEFKGMKVPVKVTVDVETKEFDVEIGVPTTSALIVKESGARIKSKDAEKPGGSGRPGDTFVGNLTMEQVIKIAKLKMPGSYAKSIKSVAKEVMGTCVSMGITVEGMQAKEALKELEKGRWDELFKEG
jgi:large subunit ribosomal protein L11